MLLQSLICDECERNQSLVCGSPSLIALTAVCAMLLQEESRPCLMLGMIDRLPNHMLQRTTFCSLALVAVTAFLKTGMCSALKCPASKCPASKRLASKCPAAKCPASKCPASRCPASKCPASEGSPVIDGYGNLYCPKCQHFSRRSHR